MSVAVLAQRPKLATPRFLVGSFGMVQGKVPKTEAKAGSASAPTASPAPTAPAPPAPPPPPSMSEAFRGGAMSAEDWLLLAMPYVDHHVSKVTSSLDIWKGLPLARHPPLQITDAAGSKVKNYKEVWNMQHCLDALTATEVYETSTSRWWLDIVPKKWHDGTDFQCHRVDWAQMQCAKDRNLFVCLLCVSIIYIYI